MTEDLALLAVAGCMLPYVVSLGSGPLRDPACREVRYRPARLRLQAGRDPGGLANEGPQNLDGL